MNGFTLRKIHPTAIVSDKAHVAVNVTIGAHCIVYDNVEIGDGSIIGPNSILGEPIASYYRDEHYQNPVLTIGKNSLFRSGALVYAGSRIGDGVELGHRVTIREQTEIGAHAIVAGLAGSGGSGWRFLAVGV